MTTDDLVVNGLVKVTSKAEVDTLDVNQVNDVSGEEISQLSGTTDNVQEQINALATRYEESIDSSNEFKTEIANAVKSVNPEATVTKDSSFSDFASDIQGIAVNVTNDADATEDDMLSGKTAYVKGAKVTGTMNNYSGIDILPRGNTANITSVATEFGNNAELGGYFGVVSFHPYFEGYVDKDTVINQAVYGLNPEVIKAGQLIGGYGLEGDASLTGTFTSDANATASQILKDKTAYVNGNKVTGTIASKAAATYTPGTSNQTIAAGQYLSGTQTIVGDADLVAANIKTGINIFGVAGTFTSDANATASQILSGKTAYVNGNKVTGTIASKAAATYTPGTSAQTIAAGQYLSGAQTIAGDADLVAANIKKGINIFGVTGTFTSDATATASQILSGKTAYVNGIKVTGNILNRTSNTGTANLSWAGTSDANGNLSGGDGTFYAGNSSDQLIVPIPNGYYNGNYNNWGCSGLVVNNISSRLGITDKARTILSGNKILGVSGTLPNYSGVVTHINYSRIANGRVEFACEEGYHGCYWVGNSYEYMSYDEVLNLIGCSADKIVAGKYILNRYGTGVNGYQCVSWSYIHNANSSASSSATEYFSLVTSSSWIQVCSSSENSWYKTTRSELAGKLSSDSFAVCRISGYDSNSGIRRGNGYSSGTTTATYRYLSDITIIANNYTTSNISMGHGTNSVTFLSGLYGRWYDCNLANDSSSTHKSQDVWFNIEQASGGVQVTFGYSGARTLWLRGNIKFEFWVFYK